MWKTKTKQSDFVVKNGEIRDVFWMMAMSISCDETIVRH